MLKRIAESNLTDAEKVACALRGWLAVDMDAGAHLYRSDGRTGKAPRWILVVNHSGQVFGGGDSTVHRFRAWTLAEAMEKGEARMAKMHAARVKAMLAESRRIADDLARIEARNSGGVFATLHLQIGEMPR